jgi:hypothetical protein
MGRGFHQQLRRPAVGCETGDWSHVDVYLTKTLDYRTLLLAGSRWEGELLRWTTERTSTVVAVGAGLGLALACDVRIVSEKARFGTAFKNVGLSGDFGSSYFLPRLIGAGHAREMDLTEAEIGVIGFAATVHDVGMTLVSPDALDRGGALTPDERGRMERHPELGAELLKPIGEGGICWPCVFKACKEAGTSYYIVEQDSCYDASPFDCLAESYRFLAALAKG